MAAKKPTPKLALRRKSADRYHHGDLRAALLAAGLELLDGQGIAAISTRALARQLKVSHGAPARHFPDRSLLLAELAAEAFDAFAQALEKGRAADPRPVQSLTAMGKAYVRFALQHPGYLRLMFSHQLSHFETPPERLATSSACAYDVLVDGVRNVLGARASEEKVQTAALAAWSQVHGLATLWLDGPLHYQFPKRGGEAAFLRMADAAVEAAAGYIAAM